ncbi:MAG: divergent PAP2 family protein [Candidatus Omnitrophota bacterium]
MSEHSVLWQFLHNKVAMTTFFGWFMAQTVKVILGVVGERRFNFKWFVGTGGMPSSHAAGVTAMATSVGLYQGVGTSLFGVALMLTIIVICDAQGVRRAAGKQAGILNTIMDDIYWKKRIQENKLKELLGHTPVQVFAGIFIGLGVAFGIYYIF